MPIIEPIPYDELTEDARSRIEAGLASGMYSTPLPLQIVAHSPLALRALDEGYKGHFRKGRIEPRLQELLRLRSAQVNDCQPCSVSRKEDSVAEEDVACLAAVDEGRYSRREVLAIRFFDLFSTDHHAITAETYAELSQEFTAEEIVELGWLCGQSLGVHRFMHTLDILGSGAPVIRLTADA